MRVVIVGAGLGGLACAIACRREGIDVVVLERSPEVREVGAGIQIPPNGGRIMRDLGVLPQLLDQGSQVQQVDFRRYKDGHLLRSMPFGDDITREYDAPWIADYYRVLLDEAIRLGANIRFGVEVEHVLTDGPEAILAGGERVSGNIVVGADGIGSLVRHSVLNDTVSLVETGDLAYRATFQKEQLEALGDDKVNDLCQRVGVTSWLGPDKHTIFYPVRGGKEFNLVLLRPDNLTQGSRREKGDIQEMRESYAGWDETLQKIISCVPSIDKWKLTHLPELPSWTKNTVTLLGDACHPTLPYQAQGAAMAVEDGAIIGKLLGLLQARYRKLERDPSLSDNEPTPETLISLLKLYEQIRKAPTTRSVQAAIMNRKLFHLQDGLLRSIRDFLLRYAGVTRKSDWTWLSSSRQRRSLGLDVLKDCSIAFEAWEASFF
ncbi:uncharacterized protein N7498_009237 [Penicillium cinerascens]|uniref:FAD-binding domain-containing protein n=1 Tax=Penicillium cinerascens TaxID=70096 RepID=A0A9W9M7S0_9EURO|nr:uncharacterized protein N7498_009237 [Penicillium cinerascens]KAJ5190252.1 hypothetical protein N7498_009237 [Penicillium cinerascens]